MRSWILLLLVSFLSSCGTSAPDDIIDGILEVPENRQNPDSRTLKLVYKVLKAKNIDSLKSPIVFLQGGPGGATLITEEYWKNNPLRIDRDIVLMDQRGTGLSDAICPNSGDAIFSILRMDLNVESEYEETANVLANCKKIIREKTVDLAGYTSKENAADFEDLRKVLGYNQWNILGGSYGSRLGLTIMRDFPGSVRSSILLSVFAPETNLFDDFAVNFENSLYEVIARCAADKKCNNSFPNLKIRLLRTLQKLRTVPLRIIYEDKPFIINSQDALLLLHQSLYNRNDIGNLPVLINALEKGESEPIVQALNRIKSLFSIFNLPMNYSVMAYEELPFYDENVSHKVLEKDIELGFEPAVFDLSARLLDNWHPYRAAPFENQAVISEIPTLMFSGSLDPITPPANATRALIHLTNGYEIIFPDESHDLFNPCFFELSENFLNNPSKKPDTTCGSKRNPIVWNL